MKLHEVIQVVNNFSLDELQQLQEYISQRTTHLRAELSPEERADRLDEAFNQFRQGLSSEQIEEMTQAMNEDYIEAWDESEWKD